MWIENRIKQIQQNEPKVAQSDSEKIHQLNGKFPFLLFHLQE